LREWIANEELHRFNQLQIQTERFVSCQNEIPRPKKSQNAVKNDSQLVIVQTGQGCPTPQTGVGYKK
jgi:hypothetical protein